MQTNSKNIKYLLSIDKQRTFDILYLENLIEFYSVIGKTVRIRRGPAAVTGDETCTSHCILFCGKGQGVDRSGSQKT